MSRSADAILGELMAELPPGFIWPRDPDSLLAAVLRPMAQGLAIVEQMAEDMLRELDPRTAVLLIGDFERVLGPDPCGRDIAALPLHKRQQIAHMRWTARGGQSVAYYVELAALRGVAIEVNENALTIIGDFECGDELVNSPEQFVWLVKLALGDWHLFEIGDPTGQLLYDFNLSDIECDIRRAKPAHTEVVFQYLEA